MQEFKIRLRGTTDHGPKLILLPNTTKEEARRYCYQTAHDVARSPEYYGYHKRHVELMDGDRVVECYTATPGSVERSVPAFFVKKNHRFGDDFEDRLNDFCSPGPTYRFGTHRTKLRTAQ